MSQIRDWGVYTSNTWAWDWVLPVFPTSTKVRPADLDGWVEQNAFLLMLDGQVTDRPGGSFKPSDATRIAAQKLPMVTYLALTSPVADFIDHDPTSISCYYLIPGLWPASAWAQRRWTRPRGDGRADMNGLIAQWAAWAQQMTGRWEYVT